MDNAGIHHHTIILNNNFTYFSGVITMDFDLNGETLNETYRYKIFLSGSNLVNKYLIDLEVECENFIT